MGCFDSVCAISGLPIRGEDPVRAFLVACSPSCIDYGWLSRTFPVRAVYDWYGRIKEYDPDDPVIDSWMLGFKKDLHEVKGDNLYPYCTVTRDSSFEDMLKAIAQLKVEVTSPHLRRGSSREDTLEKIGIPVRLVMVREDVWQVALSKGFGEDITVEWCIEHTRNLWNTRLSLLGQSRDSLMNWKMELNYEDLIASIVYGSPDVPRLYVKGPPSHWESIIESGTYLTWSPEKIDRWLVSVAEMFHVEGFMRSLSRQWCPHILTGPQHGDWSKHLDFLESITALTKEVVQMDNEMDNEG